MEALAIDDSLPILDKIKKYVYNSTIMLHRLYIVRSLADAARTVGFKDSQKHLLPVLEELMPDPEPALRQALVEQIPEFSRFYIEINDTEAYTAVLHILIPMVAELTTDRHLQVPFY